MKARIFKIVSYLFPLGLVLVLSLVLLVVLKVFEPGGWLKHLLGIILFADFMSLWYGGIPYLIFLALIMFIRSKMKNSRLNYSHLYSPILFAFIFFIFWLSVFNISGNTPSNSNLYLKTFLLPVSLYIAIGGYVYFSLAGLLFIRFSKSNSKLADDN